MIRDGDERGLACSLVVAEDYGFEAAGCNVVLRNDFDKHSCSTLKLNGASSVVECPVEELTLSDIQRITGTSRDAVDIVIGGPPCQPFSKSAYWARGDTRRLRDPRANTLNEYFRVIEEVRPKAFLLENVHGISYSGKEEGFRFLLDRVRRVNRAAGTDYHPSWRVLNAADYGVPQIRVRFFLVAFQSGSLYRFPEPTHRDLDPSESLLIGPTLEPYVTAWDALAGITPSPDEDLAVSGKWAALLPSIPEGENYLWHTDQRGGLPLFGWRTRYWSFLLKLAKRRPSWTIQAQPGSAIGPFHWENRRLSWPEMAALQTFPGSFRIRCPRVETQRQIGNAVPSLLAEVLARSMVAQLTGQRFPEPPRLAIKPSRPIPPPEHVAAVPAEYLHLVGKHAPHPGTGRGRSYRSTGTKREQASHPLPLGSGTGE